MQKILTEKELAQFEGIDFLHGTNDCYSLIRKFYQISFGITLTNYARPDDWWNLDFDLYNKYIRRENFYLINQDKTQDWKYGDLILMAIKSTQPCHAAVYLGKGKILHHFYGRKSSIELYKGIWHNTTVSVFRHKDVSIEPEFIRMELSEDERIKHQLFLLEQRTRKRGNNN